MWKQDLSQACGLFATRRRQDGTEQGDSLLLLTLIRVQSHGSEVVFLAYLLCTVCVPGPAEGARGPSMKW